MKRAVGPLRRVVWALVACSPFFASAAEAPEVAEARIRARLLHEMIHGSLQVMHRDFFKEEDRGAIPSASLEDVFSELAKTWGVRISWMAVNAKAMSTDHRPSDQFEKAAARAIEGGAEWHDEVDRGNLRFAGAITLGNRCLKCHVPDRTSLEDRKAAVLISMPLQIRDPR